MWPPCPWTTALYRMHLIDLVDHWRRRHLKKDTRRIRHCCRLMVCVCVLIMPGQFMFVACFFFAQKCNLIVSIVLSVCHILRPSFSVPFQSTSDAYRSWVMEWFASHLFAWGHSVTRRGLFNNFRGDSCAKKKHMGKCNRADLQTSLCQDLL